MANKFPEICRKRMRGDDNPYKCKPPYTGAGDPEECIMQPCELQEAVDEPIVDEPVEPTLYDCLTVIDLECNIVAEIELNGETYASDDAELEYSTIGHTLTVDGMTYSMAEASVDPLGVYTNSAGEVLTIVPCGSVPSKPPPECLQVVLSEVPTTVVPETQYNFQTGGVYLSTTASGLFQFSDQWNFTINGQVFEGPTDESSPSGLYVNDEGECFVVKDCSKVVEQLPPCIRIKLAEVELDNEIEYNLDAGNAQYTHDFGADLPAGVFDETIDGWSYTYTDENGNDTVFSTTNELPLGIFEAEDGTCLVVVECGE